ncbi:alanine--tRNA ligase [Patescibacteria group bacterium]|nr:alanine--tRNA ligase [Patescibacteria group bacterium]
MTTDEIRERYLKFFEGKGHVRIEPAPLVLENDPTTLFTSAGMQPLIPYLKGEPHPKGKRLVDSQLSLRLQDIEEVGDNRHTTYFEMLGNWSLGDYFKKEQLEWCLEFFTKELGLPKEKLWVSVFEGTKEVSKDEESASRWKELGIPEDRIFFYGVDKNWWSRSGEPDKMPAGEIGGPDSETFFDFGTPHNPKYGKECHPNCQCGRFLEIGNSVFIQYQKNKDGTLSELPQKNVDFGGGLERISAVVDGLSDVFLIDVYTPVIKVLEKETGIKYGSSDGNTTSFRIIADHLRAAVAIASEGVEPSNRGQGYILRRLLRKAIVRYSRLTDKEIKDFLKSNSLDTIVEALGGAKVKELFQAEWDKFERTFCTAYPAIMKLATRENNIVSGEEAFELFESHGLLPDVQKEVLETRFGKRIDWDKFKELFEKHQEQSRTASAGMFKGGLADTSEEVTKLHTATHLLHAALRKVLGEHVSQKGSNITAERLRFDFSHPQKLTEEEIKKVEDLVNEQIKEDLPVSFETMSLDEAIKKGALHFFGEKYGKEVKVYTIDPSTRPARSGLAPFSREVCGGPHVSHIGELGRVRIIKQEKVGAGIVRIYATTGK